MDNKLKLLIIENEILLTLFPFQGIFNASPKYIGEYFNELKKGGVRLDFSISKFYALLVELENLGYLQAAKRAGDNLIFLQMHPLLRFFLQTLIQSQSVLKQGILEGFEWYYYRLAIYINNQLGAPELANLRVGIEWAKLELPNLCFVTTQTLYQENRICLHTLNTTTHYYKRIEKYAEIIQFLDQLLKKARKEQKTIPPLQLSILYHDKGTAYIRLDKPELSEESLLKALTIRSHKEDAKNWEVYHQLGMAYHQKLNYTKALEYYGKVETILLTVDYDEELARLYKNIGNVYQRLAEYETSQTYFNKALELLKEYPDSRELSPLHSDLATMYFNWRKYELARIHNEKALAFNEGYPAGELLSGIVRNNLGMIYYSLAVVGNSGFYKKAEDCFHKAIAVFISLKSVSNEANAYHNLGNLFFGTEDYPAAEEYWKKALLLDKSDRRAADIQFNLGELYFATKEYKKALINFEKAIYFYEQENVSTAFELVYHRLSQTCTELYQYDRAIEYELKSLHQTTSPRNRMVSYIDLAALYLLKKEMPMAADYYHKSVNVLELVKTKEVREVFEEKMIFLKKQPAFSKFWKEVEKV